MFNIILILGILAAFFMIVVVLIQNPKGGGLASNFSSSTQIFGVKRTNDGVEKGTWIAAILILAVSLMTSTYNGSTSAEQGGTTNPDIEIMNNAQPDKNSSLPNTNNSAPGATQQNTTPDASIQQGTDANGTVPTE
jgi:preprotein translocase subunit SecG